MVWLLRQFVPREIAIAREGTRYKVSIEAEA